MIINIITLLIVLLIPTSVNAQVTSTDVAQNIPLSETVTEGTLLCFEKEGVAPCQSIYDSGIFGIATKAPVAQIVETSPQETSSLVARNGISLLRVSTLNGNITKGDFLTSSTTPGVAQKATDNGFVVGQALEDYSEATEGLIQVSINVHQTTAFADVRSNLFEIIRRGVSAPIITPLSVLRYLVSGAVLIASFILGFVYFGRIARVSIEAVGRNPLASRTIQITIFLNILLMLAIFSIGLALAYLILAI